MRDESPHDDLLPLKPLHYLILISLGERDHHGYALKKEIERRTDGKIAPGAGSLYRSIGQLEDEGLIQESTWRPEPVVDDERRRYFKITAKGRSVALAETERLAALVESVRAGSLAGR